MGKNMDFLKMSEKAFYDFCDGLKMTNGKLVEQLKLLPKSMKVYVYADRRKAYVNDFYVWEEGHEYRHFIELMYFEGVGEPMTVGKLIVQLQKCYSYKGKNYSKGVVMNVKNLQGDLTANFELQIKDGSLYVVGKKSVFRYLDLYREHHSVA